MFHYMPPSAMQHCQACATEWNGQVQDGCFICGSAGEPGKCKNADGTTIAWTSRQIIPLQYSDEELAS